MNALAPVLAFVLTVFVAQNPARDTRPPAAAAAATAAIRGRILTEGGAPIRNARVGLTAEGHDEGFPVFTDAYGRFQFPGLTAGRYVLSVSKAGYVTTRFGAWQPLEPPVPLEVAAGAILDNVDVRLAKGAAISGRLVDEDGNPVIGASVSAERLVRSATGLKTVTIKSSTTDDLGEYRLPELATGSYVVVADPGGIGNGQGVIAIARAGGVMIGGRPDVPRPAKVYYPSALSPAQAQILSVQPGEELTTIDMTARSVMLPHLSILVTDPGSTSSRIFYELRSDAHAGDAQTRRGLVRAGEPEVIESSPGDWDLVVDAGAAGGAYAHFTVGESDTTIRVTLKPLVKISGRILVDGRPPSGAARIALEAAPRGFSPRFGPMFSHVARSNPDGTFTLDVLQAPIEFSVREAPPAWTLQSIAIGERPLPDTWLDLGSGDPITGVTLYLSTQPTDLSGTVSDPSGQLVSDDSVLVFPKNAALLSNPQRWARWIKPDLAGHFVIRDLPEGDFYVVALRDVDDARWEVPEYLEALSPQAASVTLTAGRQASVSLLVRGPR